MLGKLIKSLLTILLLAGLSQEASAQIKRIAAGVSESGVPQYIEVYEYDYVTEKPCFPGDESGGESMFKNFVNLTIEDSRQLSS